MTVPAGTYIPHPTTLQAALKSGLQEIVFVKVDGTAKTIVGTLHPEFLPAVLPLAEGEVAKPRKAQPIDNVSFFAPELGGWRSFKIGNLVSMTPFTGELATPPAPSVSTGE